MASSEESQPQLSLGHSFWSIHRLVWTPLAATDTVRLRLPASCHLILVT
jgi:hypothetical protein